MSEVKKCSKCGGEMEMGYLPGAFSWSAGKNLWKIRGPKRILGYACENCGYVEFYLELKEKEKKGYFPTEQVDIVRRVKSKRRIKKRKSV